MVACAGSGKTTRLAKRAIDSSSRMAFITYTENNEAAIRRKLLEVLGFLPLRVTVYTWFRFLLHECVRPYQQSVLRDRCAAGILFTPKKSRPFVPHSDTARYYLAGDSRIFSDKLSQLAVDCERASSGSVTKRLSQMFDELLLDEFQDLAGYDLDLLEIFLRSSLKVTAVGDPRQHTYRTNPGSKHKKYRGAGILKLVRNWERNHLCEYQEATHSYRCRQEILTFADRLWSGFEATVSRNPRVTGHDGVFSVRPRDVSAYVALFAPQLLRYDMRTKTDGLPAINFGAAKGLQFERVLIFPNGPVRKFLESGDPNCVGSRERLYVALTRAEQSVALVHSGVDAAGCSQWLPTQNEKVNHPGFIQDSVI